MKLLIFVDFNIDAVSLSCERRIVSRGKRMREESRSRVR